MSFNFNFSSISQSRNAGPNEPTNNFNNLVISAMELYLVSKLTKTLLDKS